MLYCLHGYPWPSLATSPYRSSPPAGLQDYIPYPHIAAVCMFELVVLLLFGHMWGFHRSTSLTSSSLLLQQCPACLVHLILIFFMMGGRWPYSWCFVGCCHQVLFRIACNTNINCGGIKHIHQTQYTLHSSQICKFFSNFPISYKLYIYRCHSGLFYIHSFIHSFCFTFLYVLSFLFCFALAIEFFVNINSWDKITLFILHFCCTPYKMDSPSSIDTHQQEH